MARSRGREAATDVSDQAGASTCYRHPGREASLRCTRCDRPICLDDAVDAPVGYLCPECAQQPANVRRAQRAVARAGGAQLTRVLLGVLVVVFLGQLASQEVTAAGVTWGPLIAAGEWWRVVTGAFLHSPTQLLHIGFNGYLLWQLGHMLEPHLGTARYGAAYAAGLFGGSLGALVLSWGTPTLGASGAVFGLMGAAMVGLRHRGINPWRTSIGTLVVLNLVITFVVPSISLGGHLGGLVAGALAAVPLFWLEGPHRRAGTAIAYALVVALAAAALFAGLSGSP